MLDLKLLQNDFDQVSEKLKRKKVNDEIIQNLRDLFAKLKKQKQILEDFQANQNAKSKLFSQYAKEKKDINELKNELASNKEQIANQTQIVRQIEEALNNNALNVPNLPDEDVPNGVDENENIELKKVGNIPVFDFEPKEHWDIECNWIDFARGVKLAKSRFSVLKNDGARLQRALINYMLEFNKQKGFEEVCVPYLVNRQTLLGTGQLPKFEDDLFKVQDEELYLIPTAEVPVTNLFADEILLLEDLPIKMTSYTACFRKEAGSAGRDTRGMIRQHQFDKVELVAITSPQKSDEMLEYMVTCASELLSSLGLAHRQVLLCTGDLGFGAAKTIDLEVWLPGQNKYREISSISNTRDFQARRAKIRYKDGKKNLLVNTLNGSSLAVGRTIIAIMENYQQKDGSIKIPQVLKAYM